MNRLPPCVSRPLSLPLSNRLPLFSLSFREGEARTGDYKFWLRKEEEEGSGLVDRALKRLLFSTTSCWLVGWSPWRAAWREKTFFFFFGGDLIGLLLPPRVGG